MNQLNEIEFLESCILYCYQHLLGDKVRDDAYFKVAQALTEIKNDKLKLRKYERMV